MGHQQATDGMVFDGLWDPTTTSTWDRLRKSVPVTKDRSPKPRRLRGGVVQTALAAQAAGKFDAEIVPVEIAQKKGPAKVVSRDEGPSRGSDAAKLAALRPAFEKTAR